MDLEKIFDVANRMGLKIEKVDNPDDAGLYVLNGDKSTKVDWGYIQDLFPLGDEVNEE